ncbi:MAG: formylmethanofuran--tetrahydromethanopterin formyltransferase [Candidatus Aenigmatarchaeota archaeon]
MENSGMNDPRIEDTYAEAFPGLFFRFLVTGERGITRKDRTSPYIEDDSLRAAAYRFSSTPSTVVGRGEGGIECWLPKSQTPDEREGVVLQYWGAYNEGKTLEEQVERLYKEVSIKVRQDVLSAPNGTTSLFDWMNRKTLRKVDAQKRIGDCGGGYEKEILEYGRKRISVPLMMGYDFTVDKELSVAEGVSGANFWILSDSVETGRMAGSAAIKAIKGVKNVITSFYSCPSGSMVDDYNLIGPPTNYQFCPSLRGKIADSKVPDGVNSIPEIVINGVNLKSVENAMKEGMLAALAVKGVKGISAGNYDGKLGRYQIRLRNL